MSNVCPPGCVLERNNVMQSICHSPHFLKFELLFYTQPGPTVPLMRLRFLLALWLFLGLSACKKADWKNPSSMQMSIDIYRQPSSDGKLWFDGGFVRLSQIELQGKRLQGDDVLYTLSLNNLRVDFQTEGAPQVAWDMPQGDYHYLQFKIQTTQTQTLSLRGTCVRSNDIVPVCLDLNVPVEFLLLALNNQPQTADLSINAQNSYLFRWQINPIYWFETVSAVLWDEAELSEVDQVPTLCISKDKNTPIFDKITNRIAEGSTITLYQE